MRSIIIAFLLFIPVLAQAGFPANPPVAKDKYLKCNCHITPGITSKTAAVKTVHKKHKAKPSDAQPSATPAKAVQKPVHKTAAHTAAVTQSDSKYPGREAIIPSNKLPLPAGKAVYAPGELVYVSGRVLDENCVPVSGAIVDIWQTDPTGKYVKSTLGDRVSPDPHFTGSGRAITDNLGHYSFVTLFPGPRASRAPHINVHIVQEDFPTLDTQMYFEGDWRNAKDPGLSKVPADQQPLLMAKVTPHDPKDEDKSLNAEWDISLKGKNPYRHF